MTSEAAHANAMAESKWLAGFVQESNRIEGMLGIPRCEDVRAHADFLAKRPEIKIEDVKEFVDVVTKGEAKIRDRGGMNVRVGSHLPPPGNPAIPHALECLLEEIREGDRDPFQAHCAYESLHPFMDGNGRSGRALWAWHMVRDGQDPFGLGFLHRFYYQTLDANKRDEDGWDRFAKSF